MKRIFKHLLCLTCTALALMLASCDDEISVPDDMQIARGGEEYGYYFYVPDSWVVSNYGDFASAYVSVINPTTVSFGEAAMPDEGKDADGFTQDEVKAYFASRMANLAYMDTMEVAPEVNGVPAPFGNETNAYKFEFTYDYKRQDDAVIKYKSLQYIIVRGERLYIFQYNSQNTPPSYSTDGKTYYDIYLESAENTVNASDVIEDFKFLDAPGTATAPVAGSDGELVLVSDRSISGFDLYAPADSVAVTSTALIHRDLGNGSSVSISELVSNTQTPHPDDYWAGIKSNMERAYGAVTELNPITEENKNSNRLDITGANWGYFYEYTYSYAGTEYRGYMVLIRVDGTFSSDAYIFTYTARSNDFNKALCDEMLERLEF